MKEAINKTKRQPTKWEKTSAGYMADKRLISKYTNSSYKSITKKSNHPIRKWAEDLIGLFSKEDI